MSPLEDHAVTAAPSPLVAVNGRFAVRPVTGVERYAQEIVVRLRSRLSDGCAVLRPAGRGDGARGHAWEQLALPARFRRSGARLLLSLANFGPVAVASQLVVIHDVAPFRFPGSFSSAYARQARTLQRALARRCSIATVSEHSRREIVAALDIATDEVAIIPPAVGPPFTVGGPGPGGGAFLFVGGHDARKNLALLLRIWPEIYRQTGRELNVVARVGSGTLRGANPQAVAGVQWHLDPADAALVALYRTATAVLSPSRYEGFGLPLLEGMACGTPFLATDTGAARELAVEAEEQLLALDDAAWRHRILQWAGRDLTGLRERSWKQAQGWTWDHSAEAAVDAISAAAVGR